MVEVLSPWGFVGGDVIFVKVILFKFGNLVISEFYLVSVGSFPVVFAECLFLNKSIMF